MIEPEMRELASKWLNSYTIDNRYISRVNWNSYITALHSVCSQQENVTWRNPPHELSKSCGQIDPPSLYFRSAFTRADGQRLSMRRGVESVVPSFERERDPRCPMSRHKMTSDAIRAQTHIHTNSERPGISLSATSIFPDDARASS